MKHLWITVISLVILCRVAMADEERFVTDNARLIKRASALNFEAMSDGRSWVAAIVTPDPRNSLIVRSVSFGRDGKGVKVPGGIDTLGVNGNIEILHVLTGDVPVKNFAYKWELPYEPTNDWNGKWRTATPDPNAPYQIFMRGGLAVLPFFSDPKDEKKALPAYTISPEWKDFVAPAWKFYSLNKDVFGELTTQNKTRLVALLSDENPVLALTVCRVLSRQTTDFEWVKAALTKPVGLRQNEFAALLRQSALAVVLLENGAQPGQEKRLQEIDRFIAAATKSGELEGLSLIHI